MRRAIDSHQGRQFYSQRIGTVVPVFANLRHNEQQPPWKNQGLFALALLGTFMQITETKNPTTRKRVFLQPQRLRSTATDDSLLEQVVMLFRPSQPHNRFPP